MREEEVVIVGGGPAGMTAAIYLARSGIAPLVFEKLQAGGQMITTELIENYPGFEQGISGIDLSMKMQAQAERFGARFEYAEVHKLTVDGNRKILQTDSGEFAARAVIAASGTTHRLLGVPGEQTFFGRGVSVCGTCDGPLYKGKVASVVGGGNSALQEGLFVARFAKKVYIVHRRDQLRADKVLGDRALATPNVEFIWDTVITEIVGTLEGGVRAMRLKNKKTGAESTMPVDGVFVFIGQLPANEWMSAEVERSEEGFIKTSVYMETNVPGVFVAGDLRDKGMRQIATAIGDGAIVARAVERYLG